LLGLSRFLWGRSVFLVFRKQSFSLSSRRPLETPHQIVLSGNLNSLVARPSPAHFLCLPGFLSPRQFVVFPSWYLVFHQLFERNYVSRQLLVVNFPRPALLFCLGCFKGVRNRCQHSSLAFPKNCAPCTLSGAGKAIFPLFLRPHPISPPPNQRSHFFANPPCFSPPRSKPLPVSKL